MTDDAPATESKPVFTDGRCAELAAVVLLLLGFGLAFPTERLTRGLDTGYSGANTAVFGTFCRSYHRAPVALGSMVAFFHRTPDGETRPDDVYASKLPYPYFIYAAVTAATGVSEASLRMIAILHTVVGGVLLWWVLRRLGGPTALLGVVLYAAAPIILKFGSMPETTLPMGVFLVVAVDGYGRFIDGETTLRGLWLRSLPLAFSTSHLFAFFTAGVFFADVMMRRDVRKSITTALPLGLTWATLFGVHLTAVHAATGGIDIVFERAAARGLLAAFAEHGSPLGAVVKDWGERVGAGLVLTMLVGSVVAVRRRREQPGRCAATTAGLLTILFLHLVLLEIIVQHRYLLLNAAPLCAWIGAPALRGMLARRGPVRWVGAVVLLFCVGSFVKYSFRHEELSPFRADLVRLTSEAGKHAPRNRPVLVVTPETLFGTRLVAYYYADRAVDALRPEDLGGPHVDIEDLVSGESPYGAVLLAHLPDLHAAARAVAEARDATLLEGEDVLLYLPPEDIAADDTP